MDIYSNMEKHWRNFPQLNKLVEDKSVPDKYYHNMGMRSPYTTEFDDLHDIAEISAIVAGRSDQIRSAFQRVSTDNDVSLLQEHEDLYQDLNHLSYRIEHCLSFFEQQKDEIRKLLHDLHKDLNEC